jgi:hypothetical protein
MKYIKIIIILVFSSLGYAQSKNCNLVLIIDNRIITQNIEMIFSSKDSIEDTFQYCLGKELILNDDLFKKGNVVLNFKYNDFYNNSIKNYTYNILFKRGWIDNTNYLIIRIYNLDKKEFKKAFCKEKGDYAVEVQNQVYIESNVLCKKIDKF